MEVFSKFFFYTFLFDCFFIILFIPSLSRRASAENMAQEEGICIANTESVIHNAEDSKFDEIVLNLQEYKATAKVSRRSFVSIVFSLSSS